MPSRPRLTTDAWGFALADPATLTLVGRPAPLGRERLVVAQRLADGPRVLEPPRLVVDCWGFALADPATGTVVGARGVIVHRMLSAGHAADTRRL